MTQLQFSREQQSDFSESSESPQFKTFYLCILFLCYSLFVLEILLIASETLLLL